MTDALEDHAGTVSIGGRTITNLRFADDIDGLAGTETELANLVERLDKTSTAYGMQISAEKTKLMTNNINGISSTINVSGEKLETVQSFKYLAAIVTDEGSRPEILSRIAQATGALANLKVIWKDKNIALNTKIRLLRSLIMSIFLYACETWTLTAETERKIQTVEMRSFRRLLGISYREHITNKEVRSRIRQAIGPYKELLTIVKQRKLQCMGTLQDLRALPRHFSRALCKVGEEGTDRENDGKITSEWTGLGLSDTVRKAEEREEWRRLVVTSCGVENQTPHLQLQCEVSPALRM